MKKEGLLENLSDITGISSLDLLEKLKIQFPQIQFSMISDYGDDGNYQKAINSGAKEFFTKPINFEMLKAKIN